VGESNGAAMFRIAMRNREPVASPNERVASERRSRFSIRKLSVTDSHTKKLTASQ